METDFSNKLLSMSHANKEAQGLRPAARLFLLLVMMLASSACISYYPLWHNQQRIWEILLIFSAALLILVLPIVSLPRFARRLLYAILALGALSASLSDYPLWGGIEWGSYAGLLLVGLLIAGQSGHKRFVYCLLYSLVAVALVNAVQFLMRYQAALLYDPSRLTPLGLMTGFSNIRFLNQFQVLAMPILAALTGLQWAKPQRFGKLLAVWLFGILSVQWALAFLLGGRGMFASLIVVHAALLLFFRHHFRLLLIQLSAAVLGLVLFGLLFFALPAWLDVAPHIHATFRDGLSGRGVIWGIAWQMFLAHPWLGAGPMMFAAHINPVAAHPHQVILQWLAEWGLPATLMAIVLAAWGMWSGIKHITKRHGDALDAALWLSIAAALVLAQVDGVFVMPYTQAWLAILIGIALGRWRHADGTEPVLQALGWRLLVLPVVVIFGIVLTQQVPHLLGRELASIAQVKDGRVMPRFWVSGWVPLPKITAASSATDHKGNK